VILAAIIYFAVRNKTGDNGNAVNKPNQTSYIQFIDEGPVLS